MAKPIFSLSPNLCLEDVRKYVEDTARILKKISFGDGTNTSDSQNTDTSFLTGVSNAVANTETIFNHNLGRVPVGYIVVKLDKAATIYSGTTAWTSSTISLKSDVITTGFSVILF